MSNRRLIQLVCLVVVGGGGAYLSTSPAFASPAFTCGDDAWAAAVAQGQTGCGGGQASIVGHCVGNKVIVDEIYCY